MASTFKHRGSREFGRAPFVEGLGPSWSWWGNRGDPNLHPPRLPGFRKFLRGNGERDFPYRAAPQGNAISKGNWPHSSSILPDFNLVRRAFQVCDVRQVMGFRLEVARYEAISKHFVCMVRTERALHGEGSRQGLHLLQLWTISSGEAIRAHETRRLRNSNQM